MITMKQIGENMKYIRESKKISVYTIEKEIGISHQNLYEYEKGKREPSIMQCIKLSKYYGIDLNSLIFFE
ncbi:MAG: helix-turn-helix transcriptional regulator [Clostridia bacterium]|nr:helix-turn-helix transcriptional regulator [Clostridia bacterium]